MRQPRTDHKWGIKIAAIFSLPNRTFVILTQKLREVDHVRILGVNDGATRFVRSATNIDCCEPTADLILFIQIQRSGVPEQLV